MPKLHHVSGKFLRKNGLEIRWNPLATKKNVTNNMTHTTSVVGNGIQLQGVHMERGAIANAYDHELQKVVDKLQTPSEDRITKDNDKVHEHCAVDNVQQEVAQMGDDSMVVDNDINDSTLQKSGGVIKLQITSEGRVVESVYNYDDKVHMHEHKINEGAAATATSSSSTPTSDGLFQPSTDVLCEDEVEPMDYEVHIDDGGRGKEQPKSKPKQSAQTTFAERIAALQAYKQKHGHINVPHDESLASFCRNMRYAYRNPGKGMKLTEDRIACLDALGFDWVTTQREAKKSFEQRLEELRLYKEKHGHLRVRQKEDKSLYRFFHNIRGTRNRGTLTEDKIASLDALGFEWGDTMEREAKKSFEHRLEELRLYKEKHGHIKVKPSEDKNLYQFCCNIRNTRSKSGDRGKLTEERISCLDALGFDWVTKAKKSFEQRLEELRLYKEKHGHLTQIEDPGLSNFCSNIRYAHTNPEKPSMILTDDRRMALNVIGFDWERKERCKISFEQRINDLSTYKEKHGNLNVKMSEDKSLYQFCCNIRTTRNRGKLTEDKITSLDAIGFDWEKKERWIISFEQRINDLSAYKEKHGHLNVKLSEDKTLADFCTSVRASRSGTGTRKLTEDHIASLDALGFDWEVKRESYKSFEDRLDELKAYREKHGHLNVKLSEDKSLYAFCSTNRSARNGGKLSKERIASLDSIDFNWGLSRKSNNNINKQQKVEQVHIQVEKEKSASIASVPG